MTQIANDNSPKNKIKGESKYNLSVRLKDSDTDSLTMDTFGPSKASTYTIDRVLDLNRFYHIGISHTSPHSGGSSADKKGKSGFWKKSDRSSGSCSSDPPHTLTVAIDGHPALKVQAKYLVNAANDRRTQQEDFQKILEMNFPKGRHPMDKKGGSSRRRSQLEGQLKLTMKEQLKQVSVKEWTIIGRQLFVCC